jgi:hypothetical protein
MDNHQSTHVHLLPASDRGGHGGRRGQGLRPIGAALFIFAQHYFIAELTAGSIT